jgi:hypothetical protein
MNFNSLHNERNMNGARPAVLFSAVDTLKKNLSLNTTFDVMLWVQPTLPLNSQYHQKLEWHPQQVDAQMPSLPWSVDLLSSP